MARTGEDSAIVSLGGFVSTSTEPSRDEMRDLFDDGRKEEAGAAWERLLRRELKAEDANSSSNSGASSEDPSIVGVGRVESSRTSVRARVRLAESGVVSVRVAAYPGTVCTVDGHAVPMRRDRFGFVAIVVEEEGDHLIEVSAPPGPSHREGWIAVAGGVLAIGASIRRRSRGTAA